MILLELAFHNEPSKNKGLGEATLQLTWVRVSPVFR